MIIFSDSLDYETSKSIPDEIAQSSSHNEEHYDKKVMSPLFNVVDNYKSDTTTTASKKGEKINKHEAMVAR